MLQSFPIPEARRCGSSEGSPDRFFSVCRLLRLLLAPPFSNGRSIRAFQIASGLLEHLHQVSFPRLLRVETAALFEERVLIMRAAIGFFPTDSSRIRKDGTFVEVKEVIQF